MVCASGAGRVVALHEDSAELVELVPAELTADCPVRLARCGAAPELVAVVTARGEAAVFELAEREIRKVLSLAAPAGAPFRFASFSLADPDVLVVSAASDVVTLVRMDSVGVDAALATSQLQLPVGVSVTALDGDLLGTAAGEVLSVAEAARDGGPPLCDAPKLVGRPFRAPIAALAQLSSRTFVAASGAALASCTATTL